MVLGQLSLDSEPSLPQSLAFNRILADVSSEKQVQTMVSDVVRVLGGLDVMVANAGIFLMKSFVETTAEDLDRIIGVNLRGTFLCYKYAGLQMIAQGRGGRIIASEFGAHGITVSPYAPGPVKTPMWDGVVAALGTPKEVVEDQHSKSAAVGYLGVPTDIAALVSFLASKESHLITGQSICIDGGRFFD